MVRVGGIQKKVYSGIAQGSGADRMPPREQLARIHQSVQEMTAQQYRCLNEEILPALDAAGVRILSEHEFSDADRQHIREVFRKQILPVLTPLAIDPGHPFPQLANRSLNLAIMLRRAGHSDPLFSVVQVPAVLPRFVPLPPAGGLLAEPRARATAGATTPALAPAGAALAGVGRVSAPPVSPSRDGTSHRFTTLETVIRLHLPELFLGMELLHASAFQVHRDREYEIDDEEVEDLLKTIEEELRKRRRGDTVHLVVEADTPAPLLNFLMDSLDLEPQDVTAAPGMLDLTGLFQIYNLPGYSHLRDPVFVPQPVSDFVQAPSIWSAIRARDILIHHPYESFHHVVDFVEAAAKDDRVLAIKQTLYRTGTDSPIIRALQRAADNGKQVTVLVELKARMDEERNIQWARELEHAGVHVVFGFVNLKTHCKVALVVRKEDDGIRRYVHLSTGNYNPQTARVYTDLGFFTCKEEFGEDVSALFNYLTGYSEVPQWRKLVVAPSRMQAFMIEKIDQEIGHQQAGRGGRLIAKINGLLEPAVVKALYRGSQAGVRIDLICRGICALRPGLPGVSENIRVISIVDRFLEHSRVFYFGNGGEPQVYIGSADWMDRNLSRRVEVVFPIEQPDLQKRLIDEVLAVSLGDAVKARQLFADGHWERVGSNGEPRFRSQERFLAFAMESAGRIPTEPGILAPVTSQKMAVGVRSSEGRLNELPRRRAAETTKQVAG
jgi:polyphosphate kinase